MEIKLSAGDKIQIPTGCKATIEENTIVIEEKKEFKDGDILISNDGTRTLIFSNYREEDKVLFDSYFNSTNNSNSAWVVENFRHATEEEKQAFFDELEAKGLRWNAETKQMEKIRKREEYGESYLYVNRLGEVCAIHELKSYFDDANFNSGNYFLPKEIEEAELAAKFIKAIFEKRLKV